MKKKIIILQHNGGRFANQLWLFANVYTYCLEKGYECRNYSFFEYAKFFNISLGNHFFDAFARFYAFFEPSGESFSRRLYRFLMRRLYALFVRWVQLIHAPSVVCVKEETKYLLPPLPSDQRFVQFDSSSTEETLYLHGWLFRNPDGVKKFHKDVVEWMRPKLVYSDYVLDTMRLLRLKFERVIGVHIRRGDYRTYMNGSLFLSDEDVLSCMRQFIVAERISLEKTVFVIFSDEKINTSSFSGVPVFIPKNHNEVEDLLLLSMSDVVLGSQSTFGFFAAYYGGISFHTLTASKEIIK